MTSQLTLAELPGMEQAGELVKVIQRLSMARSVAAVQEEVRTAARRLTGADGATFVLRSGTECHYADEDAIAPLWKGQRFPMSICVSGWAMMHREPVVIENIEHDSRIPIDVYRATFVRSLAMVPIRQLDPIGAIGNYWATHHRATAQELAVLQALADSTAVALQNVYVYEELELARLDTLHRLALAAEFRDDQTHAHTQRVATTASLLAQQIGLPEPDVERIRMAAPLHDIGKIGIADSILLKPGKLTDVELAVMKTHATLGASLLSDSDSEVLRTAGEIALSHHERWDGGGYPAKVWGESIPITGRLVAVADIFDALTHKRPYKPAWEVRDAVDEIRRLGGSHLDPALVEAFERLDRTALPV